MNADAGPQDVRPLLEDALGRIRAAPDSGAVRAVETELLGKKSQLSAMKAGMRDLEHDQRRALGAALNDAREVL